MGWSEEIQNKGYWQKGIFDICTSIVDNFNSVLAALDADALTDSDYVSTLAVTDYTIGTAYSDQIKPNGIYQGYLVELLADIRTNFNDLMDKLSADATVNGTTAYTALKFTAGTYTVDVSGSGIKKQGIHQGDLVEFLDEYIDAWRSVMNVLDNDTGVAATTYESLYGIGDVVAASSSSSSSTIGPIGGTATTLYLVSCHLTPVVFSIVRL